MKNITKTPWFAVLLVLHLTAPVWADLVPAAETDAVTATRWSAYLDRARSVPPAPVVSNSVRYADKPAERHVALKQLELPAVRSLRLLTHANVPLKVVMGLIPRTVDEAQEMLAVVKQINEQEKLPADERLKLHLVCDSHETFRKLAVSQEDFDRYVEVNRFFHMTRSDVWMQDWGEIAVVDTPAEKKEQLLLLDTNRGRASLAELPASLARLWSGYFVKKPTANVYSAGDYGGNIEVTPDGVLMLGTTSSQELRDILAIGYKDRMALLDTNWLQVGHVDEYLTTIPTPKAPRGYAILKADPELGLACIANVPRAALDAEMEAMVRTLHRSYRAQDGVSASAEETKSLRVFSALYAYHAQANGYALDAATIAPSPSGAIAIQQLIDDNRAIKKTIDAQVATLVETIQRVSGDATTEVTVIPVPALFEPFVSGKSIAMLPGCANLVVLRNHVVIPDPLLDCMRAPLARSLDQLGIKSHFIPDASYHYWQGQLHCGTNVLRHPNKWLLDPGRRPLRAKQFRDLLGNQ